MANLEVDQTRLALAALSACIVKALDERIPGAQAAFLKNLEMAYDRMRSETVPNVGLLETLKWAEEFVHELT